MLTFITKLLLTLANASAVVWYWVFAFPAILKKDWHSVHTYILLTLGILLLDISVILDRLGVFLV